MTPQELGAAFVGMIKRGNRTLAERALIRDELLRCIQHPTVYAVIRDADYGPENPLTIRRSANLD